MPLFSQNIEWHQCRSFRTTIVDRIRDPIKNLTGRNEKRLRDDAILDRLRTRIEIESEDDFADKGNISRGSALVSCRGIVRRTIFGLAGLFNAIEKRLIYTVKRLAITH